MKKEVMGQLSRRVSQTALETLQTWRHKLQSLTHTPGTVLLTLLTHIFALWLSFKQVRLAFRILALLRLPEVAILRDAILSNIYLLLLAMVSCFVWLDLLVIRRLAVHLKSRFGEALPEMWSKCLCRCLPQDLLLNMKNISGVPHVQGPHGPGIPVSNMVTSSPVQLTRKNPPRACKKATKY